MLWSTSLTLEQSATSSTPDLPTHLSGSSSMARAISNAETLSVFERSNGELRDMPLSTGILSPVHRSYRLPNPLGLQWNRCQIQSKHA